MANGCTDARVGSGAAVPGLAHTLGTHPHTRVGRYVWADMQPTKGLLHGPNQRPQSLSGPKRMNATATAGKKKVEETAEHVGTGGTGEGDEKGGRQLGQPRNGQREKRF